MGQSLTMNPGKYNYDEIMFGSFQRLCSFPSHSSIDLHVIAVRLPYHNTVKGLANSGQYFMDNAIHHRRRPINGCLAYPVVCSRLDCINSWPIPKFGHGTGYMLEIMLWLPVRQRIEYRVASLVWRCQLDIAPIYLIGLTLCRSVSGITSGRSLPSH